VSYNLYELNQRGLPKLLDEVSDTDGWLTKRSGIKQQWLEFIGGVPERAPVSYTVLDETKEHDHTRLHIKYDTVFEDKITAYLLIPDDSVRGKDQDGRRAGILALHGTQELGKEHYATLNGGENRRYGLQLVSRGYIVLVPDALTAGERVYKGFPAFHNKPFYEQYPGWTSVGKNVVDHIQGIDLLCALDGVDANRIGVIGLSFGGYNSYFLAGLDERIRAFVNICGFSPFYGDPRPFHWGIRDWYTHLPKMTEHLGQCEVPFEFHEIVALAAPIPSFHYYAQSDKIFPHWEAIGECMLELQELYRFLEVEDQFQAVMTTGGHDFPTEIRTMAFAFLDRWLTA